MTTIVTNTSSAPNKEQPASNDSSSPPPRTTTSMSHSQDDTQNKELRRDEESDVYDRQIRLWGAEAQSKMSSAKVLYVNITGVSSEILKNLVLAGVRAAICDGRPYPSSLSGTPSFFLSPLERTSDATITSDDDNDVNNNKDDKNDEKDNHTRKKRRITTVARAMKPHVEELNPLLDECIIEERPIQDIPDEYFTQFDVVIASQLSKQEIQRIASATVSRGGKFYSAHCFGWYGCAIIDVGPDHLYRKELGKDKLSDFISLQSYCSASDVLDVKLGDVTDRFDATHPPKIWCIYKSFLEYENTTGEWPTEENARDYMDWMKNWIVTQNSTNDKVVLDATYLGKMDEELEYLATIATAEVSPLCAVLGGVIGNEVIKAISGRGEPANNILMLDGTDGGCRSFFVCDKKKTA